MASAQQATLPLFSVPDKPLLMLLDGHAMVHRSFHAISVQRHFSVSATGEDTTGVYGFVNVFLRAIQDWTPTHCAIAFDTPAPTFRHQSFEQYKAQRQATPPELRHQFQRVKQLMQAFAVPIFEVDGYEADDLIGTICRQAEALDMDTLILTGDRDTFQLVSPRVRVDLASGIQDHRVYNEAELAARYSGLTAAQQPDFKALMGDASDNIPGVPRVGEKRAIGLLTQFRDLEGIYQHLDEVNPPSVRQSLAENRERAFANRVLTTIVRDAPARLDPAAARFGQYDRKAVVDLLTELEFFSVVPRVPSARNELAATGRPHAPPPESPAVHYQSVQTEEQLAAMLAALEKAGRFAFDTETTSLDPMRADLVGLSFAVEPGRAWYVPVGHKEGPQLALELVLARVRPLLESPELAKEAHNANFDLMVLAEQGIHCQNVDFDSMIAAHLLGKALGLKNLALDSLGVEMTPITQLIGTGRKQITFDQVAIADAIPYAAADADMTGRLRPLLATQLASQGLTPLLTDLELPLVPVLVAMQRHGIKLDEGALHEMSRDLNQQLQQVQLTLYNTIEHSVNINSPQQLSDLLFKELGLPRTKRTKTGYYSTDANSLEFLKVALGDSDVPDPFKGIQVLDQILEYRQISKLKSTYVDALPEMINPRTRRIHTSYNQTGSATGRVSSSDPNLQNIPIRTELGRQVRKAFVAENAPDWLLFSADYSQIELRVLAHLSQDPGLLEAFRRGEDIHAATGSLMFEVPINQVTPDMRRVAKVLNFGVIYGLSPHGISQQTGFSREEGVNFIETYFSKYPGIQAYLEQVKAKTRETQYVETLLHRRRHLPEINAANFNVRGAAERMAINMPIQGTAADIMKLAMVRVHRRLEQEKLRSKMLLQVHDELVFEVPQEELEALKRVVLDEMPAALEPRALDVTLKVDTKWGPTWGDME
jgi:DNA polymerase-1